MLIVILISLVILIVSVIFAGNNREQSPTYYAILSAVVLFVGTAVVQSGILQ